MANNCLVTKLKSVVGNDNLRVLGSFVVNFQAGKNGQVGYSVSLPQGTIVKLRIIGNGYLSDSTFTQNLGKTVEQQSLTTVYVVPIEDCLLEISGIPYGTAFNSVELTRNCYADFEQFLMGWSCYTIIGDTDNELVKDSGINFDTITYPNILSRVQFPNGCRNAKGNIASLAESTDLNRFMIPNAVEVTGDVLVFANKTINILDIRYTKILGSLESLAASYASNGVTPPSCYFGGSNVTLNEKSIFDSSLTVSIQINSVSDITIKEGNTTIATYNGSVWTYYGSWQ